MQSRAGGMGLGILKFKANYNDNQHFEQQADINSWTNRGGSVQTVLSVVNMQYSTVKPRYSVFQGTNQNYAL